MPKSDGGKEAGDVGKADERARFFAFSRMVCRRGESGRNSYGKAMSEPETPQKEVRRGLGEDQKKARKEGKSKTIKREAKERR